MKKIVTLLVVLIFVGCKEETVKEPKRLIEKKVMLDVMYDLSLLEAIKYKNPTVLDSNKINPRQYIFKKYKIDSLQFAQSNVYYAADYEEYKIMFEEITKRLEKNKKAVDAKIKAEKKKKNPAKKGVSTPVKTADSLEINQRRRL